MVVKNVLIMACACKQKSSGEVKPVKQVVKTVNKKTPNTTVKKTSVKKVIYRRPI